MSVNDALNIMKLMVKLSLMSGEKDTFSYLLLLEVVLSSLVEYGKCNILKLKKSFYWTAKSVLRKADFTSSKDSGIDIDGLCDVTILTHRIMSCNTQQNLNSKCRQFLLWTEDQNTAKHWLLLIVFH